MSRWTLVVAQTSDATNLAQLMDTSEVTLMFELNGPSRVQFRLPLNSPYADSLMAGSVLVKVYQQVGSTQVLRAVTEVVTVEEVGDAAGRRSIEVQAMCAGCFRLSKRLIGKTETGFTRASQDRGQTAKDIINAVNSTLALGDGGGHTGVRVGTIVPSSSIAVSPAWRYQTALDSINLLSRTLDGFDWQMLPVDGEDNGSGVKIIGEFTAVPAYGTARDFVFEYGGGKANLVEYRRQINRQTLANVVYVIPQDWGTVVNGSGNAVSENWTGATYPTGTGRYEDVLADVAVSKELRASLGGTLAALRATAQQLVSFTPQPGVADYGVDYGVGDTVGLRAKVDGVARLNSTVRVYRVELTLDDLGRETAQLTLTPETL